MKISDETSLWRGWKVWIESNGVKLPEHAVVHDAAENHTTLYVESVIGQMFTIRARRPKERQLRLDVELRFSIDGAPLSCRSLAEAGDRNSVTCQHFKQVVHGVLCNRDLTFGKMNLTEDAPRAPDEILSSLGTVTVALRYGTREDCGQKTRRQRHATGQWTAPINERTKKGIVGMMVVGGGKATPAEPRRCYKFSAADDLPSHRVTFIYRPREVLMAQGIVARPETRVREVDEPDAKPAKRQKVKRESGSGQAAPVIDLTRDEPRSVRKTVLGSSKATAIEVGD